SGVKRIEGGLAWGKLQGEGRGKSDESGPCSAISCVTSHPERAKHGRDHDDAAAVGKMRSRSARYVICPNEIGLENIQPRFGGGRIDRSDAGGTRVVDHYLNLSEAVHDAANA